MGVLVCVCVGGGGCFCVCLLLNPCSVWVSVCLYVFLRLGECESFEVLRHPPPSVIHKETKKKQILKIESRTKFLSNIRNLYLTFLEENIGTPQGTPYGAPNGVPHVMPRPVASLHLNPILGGGG